MFRRVVQQAQTEWKGHPERLPEVRSDDRSDWLPCSLCHEPNKEIHYIINTRNGIELNVGSTCIKAFDIKYDGVPISQLIKKAHELRRLNNLNEAYPGIAGLVEGWSHDLDQYPILISARLENLYTNLGRRITSLYQDYLSCKLKASALMDFAPLLDERRMILEEVGRYVAENRDKRFAPTREIATWLRTHSIETNPQAIRMLKEDGQITQRTLWRIEEPRLVTSLVPDFDRVLRPLGMSVEKADTNYNGLCVYILVPLLPTKVRLLYPFRETALNFGGPIFGEDLPSSPTLDDLVSRCRLYGEDSVHTVVARLSAVLRGTGIALRQHSIEFNEVDVYEESTGKFVVLDLKKLTENYKCLALGLGDRAIDELVQWAASLNHRRYTADQLKESRILRRRA